MSREQVYQWMQEIAIRLPGLSRWQALGLALFSVGVVLAERCTLSKVAEKLLMMGKADSVERRLQRWLSNVRLDMTVCCRWWIRWVVCCLDEGRLTLLVDETKLGDHLGVMLVGLAYRQRCIPLVWCCYSKCAYPAEGQVRLIAWLLAEVKAALPPGPDCPLVQADRGIGTSPDLVAEVTKLGWHYLFRVQNSTKLRTAQGKEHHLRDLIKPGECWFGRGQVFKKAGWPVWAWVHLLWDCSFTEPWCLITNNAAVRGRDYAMRNWQEQAFRDLKSGGWQWQRSQVWRPAHADRLLLVLALAYAWTLTHGTLVAAADPATRHCITRGSNRIYSLFREGLRYLAYRLHHAQALFFGLLFVPDKPLCPQLS